MSKNSRCASLQYRMRQELMSKKSYGQSKQADIERAISEGKSRDYYTRNKIYSVNTFSNYCRNITHYADFIKENYGRKTTLKEAHTHMQDYINYLNTKGYSAWTVRAYTSAALKIFGDTARNYVNIPNREIKNIKRGRDLEKNTRGQRQLEDSKYARLVNFQKAVGIRRNELANLRENDLVERNGNLYVHVKNGKGGREQFQLILEKDKELVKKYFSGTNDFVFSKNELKNDIDLHKIRAERAAEIYNKLELEMRENSEIRDFYKKEIEREFARVRVPLKENLDKPYYARCSAREKLLEQGRQTEFDRTALMYVSVFALAHWRSNVTVEHYIIK